MSTTTIKGTVWATKQDGTDALDLRRSQSGAPWLAFQLVESHRRRDQSGQWQDDERKGSKGRSYWRVTIFDLAEETAEMIRAACETNGGHCQVLVTGSPSIDVWERREGGTGTTASLIASAVGIVPARANQDGGQRGGQRGGSSQGGQWGAPQGGAADDPWASQRNPF